MPKCEICGKVLKNPSSAGHINSKYHQDALKKGGEAAPKEVAKTESIKTPTKVDKSKKPSLKPIKLPPKLDKTKPAPKLQKLELKPLKIEPKPPKAIIKDKASEYASEEDLDLGIPMIPEPPKKKETISANTSGLSPDILERMQDMEADGVKVVLINCDRCGEVIPVPVPRDIVLNDGLPVVPITYVHFNGDNKDQHCITLYLDHDFDIRRQRESSVVIASKYQY